MEIIPITTEFIRLDAALKLSGLVGGEPCPLRGKKLYPGDSFSLGDREFQVARAEG